MAPSSAPTSVILTSTVDEEMQMIEDVTDGVLIALLILTSHRNHIDDDDQSKSSTAVAITPATGDVVPEEGGDGPVLEKQQPNFAPTGALAAETNTVAGVVLKYNEPPEARKPPGRDAWRMYVFKGDDLLETVELGGRSCWLVGRERLVVDFPVDHPSCSKQHAVIQFRYVTKTNEFGDKDGRVRPYVIDLESANGTTVNADKIPATRYVELRDKDVIQFGLSTREYVLMLPPQD
ncbi:MAG: hypothetical protein M1825_005283 [Sarcosagium campestre]|nr:MAG: hypothetical protein M1825_005283 [Sarcosagium campestre]